MSSEDEARQDMSETILGLSDTMTLLQGMMSNPIVPPELKEKLDRNYVAVGVAKGVLETIEKDHA